MRVSPRIPTLIAFIAAAAPMAHAAAPGTPWYADPAKHLAMVSLILFFVVVWRAGGFKFALGALDKRADGIAAQIEEAKALRDKAAKMLGDAERRQKAAQDEAEQIIAQARQDADAMMAEARAELQERMARREALAESRISRAEQEAAEDVRRAAADAATEAARRILKADKNEQFDAAADALEKALN